MQRIVIKTNDVDQRLDNFLKKAFPKLSLNAIYRHIRTKNIKINDKKCQPDYHLHLNDVLNIYINDDLLSKLPTHTDFLLAPANLNIVYEDDNILIVNKPVGLVVHQDKTNTVDTLINRIKHYLYNKKVWNYQQENTFTPSLIHRIDRNTNGLILAAKNAKSLQILNAKLKTHQIEKYYFCQVHGIINPPNGVLKGFLTRNLQTKIVKISQHPINRQSQEIITEYRTISHDRNISLLEIKLITGKTHQIRAHLASINHPIVGEQKYTTPQYSYLKLKNHQQLTAYKIIFNFKTDAEILNYLNHKTFKI